MFSQQLKENVFTLKPALGINVCQVHGDSYSGFNKVGFFGGLGVNAFLNKKSSLEFGFYFSQKGARHNPNPVKGDYNYYALNLNYIDLPVSFRYNLNKDFFITAGPSLAYLAGYSENINYVNYSGAYPFHKFEYGVNFGLGKKIKDRFFIEVRCSNSFLSIRPYGVFRSNVYYSNFIAQIFNDGFYNNIITAFVAYKIDLKRKSNEPK